MNLNQVIKLKLFQFPQTSLDRRNIKYMKKALITGIDGFVGPHLKKELENNGYEVFGIDREEKKEINCFGCDITNADSLNKIIQEIKPTHVFHLAGFSSPRLARKNPELAKLINVQGTRNLFESILFLKNKPKVFVAGSSHVYGAPQYLPIDEKHPVVGEDPYSESRVEQEKLIQEHTKEFFAVSSRSFNHTGPGQTDIFVVPKIIRQIVEIKQGKRKYIEMGDINLKRDFCDVRDVVRAYRFLIEQDENGVVANVCRGESVALKKVAESVKLLAGLDSLEIQVNQDFVNKNDAPDIYGDYSFLNELTGWKPEIVYKQMFQDMYHLAEKKYK